MTTERSRHPRQSSRRAAAALRVDLRGDHGAVVTLPPILGPSDLRGLSTTVAGLAHEAPEIVVDLTEVRDFNRLGAELLLRLGALARGAGGHLRARCAAGSRPARVVELDVEHAGPLARLDGPVGRAFRSVLAASA